MSNLGRLKETEDTDRQGVFQILGVFENLLSFMPPLAEQIVNDTTFLPWLLKRISEKEYDSNKQYASEVLAIIMQEGRAIALKVGELDGMNTLLMVLSVSRLFTPHQLEVEEPLLTPSAIPQEGPRRYRRGGIHGKHL